MVPEYSAIPTTTFHFQTSTPRNWRTSALYLLDCSRAKWTVGHLNDSGTEENELSLSYEGGEKPPEATRDVMDSK